MGESPDLSQRVTELTATVNSLDEKMDRILTIVDGSGHQLALDLRLDRLERARLSERIEAVEKVVLQLDGVKWGLVKTLAILAWAISVTLPIILKWYG